MAKRTFEFVHNNRDMVKWMSKNVYICVGNKPDRDIARGFRVSGFDENCGHFVGGAETTLKLPYPFALSLDEDFR